MEGRDYTIMWVLFNLFWCDWDFHIIFHLFACMSWGAPAFLQAEYKEICPFFACLYTVFDAVCIVRDRVFFLVGMIFTGCTCLAACVSGWVIFGSLPFLDLYSEEGREQAEFLFLA